MVLSAIRLSMWVAMLSVAPDAVAQSIQGIHLGDDKSVLQRLGDPVQTKGDGLFTTQSYLGSDRTDLNITYEEQSHRIVALQATWPRVGI